MSIALVVTSGFGNGTFVGDIANVVTRGYMPGDIVIPPAVIPGIPGPVRKVAQWDAGHHWNELDLTVTQRARVWINRVQGFEERIGTIEDELDVIDATLLTLQKGIDDNLTLINVNRTNIAANFQDIQTNIAAIAALDLQIIDIVTSIAAIDTRLDALELSNIVETSVDYQVITGDIIVNGAGSFQVTLIPIALATKPIIITSTSGTISVISDATIDGASTVTTGSSITLYPARGKWFHS